MRRLFVLLSVLTGVAMFAGSAQANVINVTTTVDQFAGTPGSGCSLRDAFNGAVYGGSLGDCAMSGADDTISLPEGTYTLTVGPAGDGTPNSGDLDFAGSDPVTIEPQNPGDRVVIDGGLLDRIFDHIGGGVGDLILRNVTLTGGYLAAGFGFDGGAIRTTDGLVRLEGVTAFGNTAGEDGGAVWVGSGASLEAINSTFSQNRARNDGGGISLNNVGASADLRSVTISENRADDDGDGLGNGGGLDGGIGNSTVMMLNSILAGNDDGSPNPSDQVNDCVSNANFMPRFVISSQQLGAGECFATLPAPDTNQSPVNAGLQGFGDNGGLTATYGLTANSPALAAGGSAFPDSCPATDQRGVARPAGKCDIGAFQRTRPLPGRASPNGNVAVFDGTFLYLKVKCPAIFKPKCRSTVAAVTRRRTSGFAMTRQMRNRTVTRSGRFKTIRLTVLPAYRARISEMTYQGGLKLTIRQQISSRFIRQQRAGNRKQTTFHRYRVRVRTS